MHQLKFESLRLANLKRLPLFKNCHGEPAHTESDGSDWSPAQWLQAAVGELGEYANKRKKFERGDITEAEFDIEARHELADVIIYLDILAYQLGIDLGAAVVEKFNIVSARIDCPVTLFNHVPEPECQHQRCTETQMGRVVVCDDCGKDVSPPCPHRNRDHQFSTNTYRCTDCGEQLNA